MVLEREAGKCVGQCKGQEAEWSLFMQGMAGCWLE